MRILLIGGGGREHALARFLWNEGKNVLLAAPGNPGIGEISERFPVAAHDLQGLVELALEKKVDLVVAGPEKPLVEGIGDLLDRAGIPCFGPSAEAAGLEGSKWFAKEIMDHARVPTAEGEVFTEVAPAEDFISGRADEFVIKADGLAAGKGVFLPETEAEASGILNELFQGRLGDAGMRVVIEERLRGREASILAFCSGSRCVLLPPSRDHKRLNDGDLGPNTGGMGAICPVPDFSPEMLHSIRDRILQPVLDELLKRGIDYRGILYAGLMLTDEGPRVLEFNVRFGDPETQAVLPLLRNDLAELCLAAAKGDGLPDQLDITPGACTCVVMASGGYPGVYRKGLPISGLERISEALVFHAGTALDDHGRLVTAGGRVLGVSAVARDLQSSIDTAYREAAKIEFEDSHMRTDIGGI